MPTLDHPLIDAESAQKPPATIPVWQRKDFNLICFFGFILSFVAGWVNVCNLIATTNVTSHHTGTATWLGRWIGEGKIGVEDGNNWAWFYVIILLCFISGAAMPPMVLVQKEFHSTPVYGYLMIVIGCLFLFNMVFFELASNLHDTGNFDFNLNFYTSGYQQAGIYISSFACGIQNALCTQLTGAVVRTTHVTGLCTDVGMEIGRILKKHPNAAPWKLRVLLPILIGFITGCALGCKFYELMYVEALAVPGVMMIAMGSLWLTCKTFERFRK